MLAGFIPKAISYILRIAGILHCLERFSQGANPEKFINGDDITRAILIVEFYLSHTVRALRLMDPEYSSDNENEMRLVLSKTLNSLRNELDSGRLAVGYIFDKYNKQCDSALKIKSEKGMGSLLRQQGLTIDHGKHDANGRRGVFCLIWDEKAEKFVQTLRISTEQPLPPQPPDSTDAADIADIADISQEDFEKEGDVLC